MAPLGSRSDDINNRFNYTSSASAEPNAEKMECTQSIASSQWAVHTTVQVNGLGESCCPRAQGAGELNAVLEAAASFDLLTAKLPLLTSSSCSISFFLDSTTLLRSDWRAATDACSIEDIWESSSLASLPANSSAEARGQSASCSGGHAAE